MRAERTGPYGAGMPTAHLNGIDVTYTDSGGDGPAILFSHGFLMDHTMFDPQVAEFSGSHRCVTWDARGFGGTRVTEPFSYWDSADDAVALLDHLGIDRAVFVGMSQGGFMSLRAALAHPARVAGVVLIDSAADVDDEATITEYREMIDVFTEGADEQREAVYQVVAGLILGTDELAATWIPKWRRLDPEQLGLAGHALLDRDDITSRLASIECPLLAVHGTADTAITIDRAHALVPIARDHRGVVAVEGAAHAPNLSHPDQVNRAIADFLASL